MDYKNQIFNMDCLAGMAMLPDALVDMVLTDLPYGTTSGAWDTLLPLPELWRQLNRVTKRNGAMVFTAAQPFTTTLIASNPRNFRYCWYWIKNQVTGFPFAHFQPLRCVEDVAVFYRAAPTYPPPRGWWRLNIRVEIRASGSPARAFTARRGWRAPPGSTTPITHARS